MQDTHGTVIWSELMTRDIAGAQRYYTEICGWSFTAVPMGPDAPDYILGMRGGAPVAGLVDMTADPDDSGKDPYWLSYLAVDDVDAAVATTIDAGGSVQRAPFDVPETGRVAVVIDPTGAMVGLMTPAPMPES
ncbi:VOC family protein [Roseivivax sp. CAU 1753]